MLYVYEALSPPEPYVHATTDYQQVCSAASCASPSRRLARSLCSLRLLEDGRLALRSLEPSAQELVHEDADTKVVVKVLMM